MDEHHAENIAKEPDTVQLSEIGLLDVLEFLVARNEADDGRATERHQGGGTCVKSWCSSEKVDGQT